MFELSISIGTSIDDVIKWKLLLQDLLKILIGQNICLLTTYPQRHSVGYELKKVHTLMFDKTKYLINSNIRLSDETIDLTFNDEDFQRGFLHIIVGKHWDEVIENISQLESVTTEIIRLEDDSKTLLWYNPSSLVLDKIQSFIDNCKIKV